VLVTLTAAGRDLERVARDIPHRAARAADLAAGELDRLRTSLLRFTSAVTPSPTPPAATSGRLTDEGEA